MGTSSKTIDLNRTRRFRVTSLYDFADKQIREKPEKPPLSLIKLGAPLGDPTISFRQSTSKALHGEETKKIKAELVSALRLQLLLSNCASRFLTMSSENVENAIKETQHFIVEALNLDSSMLWENIEHETNIIHTCWRGKSGAMSLPLPNKKNLPWIHTRLKRCEIVSFSDLSEAPNAASRDVDTIRAYGAKSILILPLVTEKRVFGALAFATQRQRHTWQQGEIIELKLLAQLIGTGIERQRAKVREDQLRCELTHANRVATLGELAATIAHELNQPLAAILSNAQAARQFLTDGPVDVDELKAILDDVVRDDKRAGNVIYNLRSMMSKQPSPRELCCLNQMVLRVFDLLNSALVAAKVEIRTNLTPDMPSIMVGRIELQQVLVNLLVNALQALENNPPEWKIIEVETRANMNTMAVTVRDHGPGIPPERLPNIFNPFFSTKTSGMGIGLSICRRIIESHAGSIQASNHRKGGAIFCFTLPVPH